MRELNELHAMFLETELFAPFREHPECLRIEPLDGDSFVLHLTRFPELDVTPLNPHAFALFTIPFTGIHGGHVISGSPEGVSVQFVF